MENEKVRCRVCRDELTRAVSCWCCTCKTNITLCEECWKKEIKFARYQDSHWITCQAGMPRPVTKRNAEECMDVDEDAVGHGCTRGVSETTNKRLHAC